MNRVRVEIDLNSLSADGTTRARLSRASGRMDVGQIVTAFESEDAIRTIARVERIDRERGYVFLTVNRQSFRDDDGTNDVLSFDGANRALASVANAHAERSAARTHAAHMRVAL